MVKHRIVVRAREEQDEAPGYAGALTEARLAADLAVDVEQVRMALVERQCVSGSSRKRGRWMEDPGVLPEVSD